MYNSSSSNSNSRKASRETCASSPSPASSPATPSADRHPTEPLFTEYSSHSAMLDSIGAWSSVQPIPAPHAPLADIRELRGKYGSMTLNHKPQQHVAPYPGTDSTGSINVNSNGFGPENMHGRFAAVGGGGGGIAADVDYSELDEAILRGRSTTLPDIFTVPNPVYRFSTVASIDTSGSPGPISPVSSSTLGVLSRHGSVSISNSNRTVSPLGVPINSNSIHRTASLDNPLTLPLDHIHTVTTGATARYDALGTDISGLHPKANPNISGSVSSTSTLVGIGNVSAMPIRRLSEYSAETTPHPALSLASYSMGPGINSAGVGAGDFGVNGSGGMSHGGAGRATLTPLSISGITDNASSSSQSATTAPAIASTANPGPGNGHLSNDHIGDSNAYPPGMHARYAQLGHHLPTMREEDASATLESTAVFADSTLMRNMSMPSFGNSALAAPLPQQLDSSTSLFAINRVSTASPISVNRRTSVEPVAASFAASDSASDIDLNSASMYAPQRVRSLKDMRRPSLDVRSDNVTGDTMLDGSAAANALFERSSGIRQSMAINYLSGMSNLHRRHSLAGANPLANAAFGPAAALDYNSNSAHLVEGAVGTGDFKMYPPSALQQNIYHQGPMFPASYGAFATHPDQVQRQQSMSVQPAMQNPQVQQQQQQQQQMYTFQQYQTPASVGNVPVCSSSSGAPLMAQLSGMVPRTGFYAGSFIGSQPIPPVPPLPQQQQQTAMRPLQPMHVLQNLPPLLQPVPVPLAMQQAQLHASQQRPLRSQPQSQPQNQNQNQRQQSQLQPQQHQQQQSKQPQHHHMRRASHSAIVSMGHSTAPMSLYPTIPMMNGGGSHALLPNPATTITPNMPFADMGKGLPFQSLPKEARVFVVQFKGTRCDLFFSPTKDMDVMVIPTLALSAVPVPASEAAFDQPSEAQYMPGTHVLVEADRGVDLGVIKEELLTEEAVKSFSVVLLDNAANSGGVFGDSAHSDGRNSVAPADSSASLASSNHSSKPSSNGAGHSVSRKPSASEPLSLALTGSPAKDVLIKRIFRVADQREVADITNNKVLDEQNALIMCQSKVQQRKLTMCVVDAEFQFDRRKLTFYFKADRRVDFRELVRELFKHFKTRIWMCQQTS